MMRARLSNPDLLFSGKALSSTLQETNLLEALQAPPYVPPQGPAYASSRDLGWAVIISLYPTMLETYLRPARVTGEENPELVPNLPMETWRLPLYDDTGLAGRYLPMRAVHELFAAAWERIKTGDVPRGGE